MHQDEIGRLIVDAAYHVHRGLGPGLLESVYQKIFSRQLSRTGLFIEGEKWISFDYDGVWFEDAFKADLIVERLVVVEIKSVVELKPVHYLQLLTYLRLMDLRLGYLINFGAPTFKAGIKRVINSYQTDIGLTPRRQDAKVPFGARLPSP